MSKDLDSDQGYKFLDHPADVWVHAWGPTLEAAMAECVRGLMQTMIEVEITPIAEKEETFICQGCGHDKVTRKMLKCPKCEQELEWN